MVNGRAWTMDEHQELRRTLDEGSSTVALAKRIGRTHKGVISRAERAGLSLPSPLEREDRPVTISSDTCETG